MRWRWLGPLLLATTLVLGCGDDSVSQRTDPIRCAELGEDCDVASSCCEPLLCVRAGDSELDGCQVTCQQDAECDSGCCRHLPDHDSGYCAPARFCSCGEAAATCGGFEPDCCPGLACTQTLDEREDDVGELRTGSCKPRCQVAADCDSACCGNVSETGEHVCLSAEYCARDAGS